MVLKLILIFFFIINITKAEIIYDKENILVTQIELSEYIKIYNNNYDTNIKRNEALKNIILMKKSLDQLTNTNPTFLINLDAKLKSKFGDKILNNFIKRDFMRLLLIRNEFITEYFQKDFDINDLQIIFNSSTEINLPISKNDCLTIEAIVDLKENSFFIESFYKNLKNNTQKYIANLNDELLSVCISSKSYQNIESLIIQYIENKTSKSFNNFIYGKLN